MHIRITRGTFDPSKSEEQLIALTEATADAIKKQPGFVSFQSGLNHPAGTLVAVSTWQDEGSANFPREALGPVMSQIMELGVQLEAPEIYEVGATA
jgi:quinol monooxygenase YgiN